VTGRGDERSAPIAHAGQLRERGAAGTVVEEIGFGDPATKCEPCASIAMNETTFALSSTGKPRNSARSANAKPIVAAPIASASVATISR
jgi:hypothetical protein